MAAVNFQTTIDERIFMPGCGGFIMVNPLSDCFITGHRTCHKPSQS